MPMERAVGGESLPEAAGPVVTRPGDTMGARGEETDVRSRWPATVAILAVALAGALGGCGVRLSSSPAPSGRPSVAATAPSASPPPATSPSPSTMPASPSPPVISPSAAPSASPDPSAGETADLEAAVRRLEAAAAVKRMLPQFDQLAAGMVARSGVPGAAVAVVAGDGAVYVRCFGLRRIGRAETVDKDTLFQLGGVSQGFTTAMMAALVGEGEIDWDRPVRRAWPGFRLRDRWASSEATFRDLTAMRSGLPAHAGSELTAFGYDRAEIIRRLRYLEPATAFRTAYAPQDAVVTAAAVAAERATGRSWARLVRSRLVEPLGMATTALTYGELLAATDRADPHRLVDGSMRPGTPPDESLFAPSRGVSASVADLVAYVRMQLNGGAVGGVRVAPAEVLAETLKPATPMAADLSGPTAFALGWETRSFDGRLVARSSGDLEAGSSVLVTLVPADGVGVVVLANAYPQGRTLAAAVTATMLDLYLEGAPGEDWLGHEQALSREGEAGADGPRPLPPQPETTPADPSPRRVYEGVYTNRYYGRVTVRPGPGDGLRVRLGHGATLRYVPWNGDVWREPDSGTAAVFTVRGGRAVTVRLALLAAGGRDGRFARRD